MNWDEIFEDVGNTVAWKISKRGVRRGSQATAKTSRGYLTVGVNGRLHSVHRILWEMRNGPIPAGMQIDHINRIRDDNRPENLRLATPGQNAMNTPRRARTGRRPHSTGVKGVSFVETARDKPYRAQVCCKGHIVQAQFSELVEAATWVKQTREKLHQEYAHHG